MKRRFVSGRAGVFSLLLGVVVLAIAAPSANAQRSPASRTLAEGLGMGAKPDAGVRELQRELRGRGRSLGPTGVDGRFGPRTEVAVKHLQASFGLVPDGVVGPNTRKLLRAICVDGCARRAARPVGDRTADIGAAGSSAAPGPSHDGSPFAFIGLASLFVLALAYGWWLSERGGPASAEGDEPEPGKALVSPRRVVGYLGEIRASLPRAGMEAQEAAIEAECKHRGWELLHVFSEVPGGTEREALVYALERIVAGEATCLMVGELERVGGSAAELGYLLEWFVTMQAGLVVLDVGVDTTSREGALAADMLVSVTKAERKRTLARTGNGWRANARGGIR